MVFTDGCLGARARYRETSELSGPRWRSPRPPRPGSHIKSGLGEGGSSGADDGGAPRGPRPAVAPRFGKRTRELPVGTMRCRELPLVLLALLLCQAPRAPAAPVRAAGETALAKMYPRGNHWAVGHLMGKKSTGESPYVYEGGSPKYQLRQHILWEEAVRTLLGLMEGKGTGSHQSPPQGAPGYSPVYSGFRFRFRG